ncbi:MAG: serine/threonine-protein kinase [Nannocystaceae bacterium]
MQIDPHVPTELGEYRTLEFIGRGGMGEVWLACKKGQTKPCVLKILRPRLARDQEYRRRFFREAQIGASLRHGRIVPVLEYGEAKGHLYLVMEFIDGIDLAGFGRALEEGGERIPIAAVGYVIGEVFEALRHAHDRTVAGKPRGVIHRDVTPRNVLISSEGEVFLTDFGIARYEADISGETFGTLQYMAPEQARGEACFESDIYGAAGVLHFMLTGEAPRRVTNACELAASLGAPPPAVGRSDVPEPLERLRVTGLVAEPERRIATADDALTIIDSWGGYRKATRVLAQLYRRYVGLPRSGMTKLEAAAKAERDEGKTRSAAVARGRPELAAESARMTVKVSPGAPLEHGDEHERGGDGDGDEDLWDRPWWNADDDLVDEEEQTRRYVPPSMSMPEVIEPDAPRILRRPRRPQHDSSLDVEHLPPLELPEVSS